MFTREEMRKMKKIRCLYNEDVSIQAILFLLGRCGGTCDIHKICKMLYYADQHSMVTWGRSITGDAYIAMPYGPVPSNIEDAFKGLRDMSYYFSEASYEKLSKSLSFVNKFTLKALSAPDLDYLSESDIECLDFAYNKCKDLNFSQLTEMSHGLAWNEAKKNGEMSTRDIMRETGCSEELIDYVIEEDQIQLALL